MLIRAYREASESGREVDGEELRRQAEATARRCLPPAGGAPSRAEQLPSLARLYVEAGRYPQASAALGRYLLHPGVGRAKKAETLLQHIGHALHSYSLHTAAAPERASLAESYLKKLVRFGPPFVKQRLDGHARMARHYLSAGEGTAALRHQSEVVRLIKRSKPDERTKAASDFLFDLLMLADLTCNKEGAGRALAALENISPELISLAGAEQAVLVARSRYELAGRAAPVPAPRYVLNEEAGTAASEARGRVTVMLFAAQWCGPCRALYPRASEIHERFRQDGVRVLLVTRLYGNFGDRKGLKPEEELAALRDYYVGEMKLKFPILVEAQPVEDEAGGAVAHRDQVLFGFLPQVLVIDRGGVTRAVLIGALPGQGERLRAAVEELVAESK